jgi:hypothetical protein
VQQASRYDSGIIIEFERACRKCPAIQISENDLRAIDGVHRLLDHALILRARLRLARVRGNGQKLAA